MVVKTTCPRCKKVIYGYKWAKTKSGKNWLMNDDGEWHSCGEVTKKKKYGLDMFTVSAPAPRYFSCGKCGGNCIEIEFFEYYCEKCEMYPQLCHRRMDEKGGGPTDQNVKAGVTSNRQELTWELLHSHVKKWVLNWMQMNVDGTVKECYKLYPETKKWFEEEGGKEIIIELDKQTIIKKQLRGKPWKKE